MMKRIMQTQRTVHNIKARVPSVVHQLPVLDVADEEEEVVDVADTVMKFNGSLFG